MKVAYIALAPFISGSERSLQQILQNITNYDVTPVLICPPGSPLLTWARAINIICYEIDISYISPRQNPIEYIKRQWALFRVFRKEKINIMHSNQLWSYSLVAPLCALLNIKKVCHFRDPVDENSNWWINSTIDLAVFISTHIETSFIKAIEKKRYTKCYTIINPVSIGDDNTSAELQILKSQALEQLALPQDKFSLGYIGQLADVKGVKELIDACALLPNSDWQLIIAGEDPSENQSYLNECKALAKHHKIEDKLFFVGFLENTADFYHAADVVVMLSKREPLGRVPLEAGAYYTPTIATAVDGLPETIVHNKTGWLIGDATPQTVASIIVQVFDEDLVDFGNSARQWVEEISDPLKYNVKLSEQYKLLLKSK